MYLKNSGVFISVEVRAVGEMQKVEKGYPADTKAY